MRAFQKHQQPPDKTGGGDLDPLGWIHSGSWTWIAWNADLAVLPRSQADEVCFVEGLAVRLSECAFWGVGVEAGPNGSFRESGMPDGPDGPTEDRLGSQTGPLH